MEINMKYIKHIYPFYLKLLDLRCCFLRLRNFKNLAIGFTMTRFLKFLRHKNQIAKKPVPSGRMSIFLITFGIIISLNVSAAPEDCLKLSLSYSEARAIALNSECAKFGYLLDFHWCNPGTNTWWIALKPYKPLPNCRPACVIDVVKKTASVNAMCTGVLPH